MLFQRSCYQCFATAIQAPSIVEKSVSASLLVAMVRPAGNGSSSISCSVIAPAQQRQEKLAQYTISGITLSCRAWYSLGCTPATSSANLNAETAIRLLPAFLAPQAGTAAAEKPSMIAVESAQDTDDPICGLVLTSSVTGCSDVDLAIM